MQTFREKSPLKHCTLGGSIGGICFWKGNEFLIGKTSAHDHSIHYQALNSGILVSRENSKILALETFNPSGDGTRVSSLVHQRSVLHAQKKGNYRSIMLSIVCHKSKHALLYKKKFSTRLLFINKRVHWRKRGCNMNEQCGTELLRCITLYYAPWKLQDQLYLQDTPKKRKVYAWIYMELRHYSGSTHALNLTMAECLKQCVYMQSNHVVTCLLAIRMTK